MSDPARRIHPPEREGLPITEREKAERQLGAQLPESDCQGLSHRRTGQGIYASPCSCTSPGSGIAIREPAEQAARARTTSTMSCTQAHCEWGRGWRLETRRPSSHRRTSVQEVQRPRARIPEESLCLSPPRKASESTVGESPGPFLGPGSPAAAEWSSRQLVGLPGAAQVLPRMQDHVAASPKALCALDRQVGQALAGCRDLSHKTTSRTSSAPPAVLLGVCYFPPCASVSSSAKWG